MGNKISPIDKLFNENLRDSEVSGKKGNWELMRHLIKEQQKKAIFLRKMKLMAFGGVGMLLIFSTILFLPHAKKRRPAH